MGNWREWWRITTPEGPCSFPGGPWGVFWGQWVSSFLCRKGKTSGAQAPVYFALKAGLKASSTVPGNRYGAAWVKSESPIASRFSMWNREQKRPRNPPVVEVSGEVLCIDRVFAEWPWPDLSG